MVDSRLVITESGFLTEFLNQHTQRTDRPFCFILGAGASRSSGIPTGAELANVWLRELHEAENFDGLGLNEWATPERLGVDSFNMAEAANFYPQLYQRRYGDHEQAGYAFLESQMEGKEPSYGYSVLAYLLSETSHRVVITTNFDNLVADALSIHSSRFPLVIGHDSLAQYAAVELRRPLVAKIHGALGFSPKSQPDDISQLPEGWQKALARILDRYTPIVIGYGGNDGSLMGFLQALPSHIPDRIYWCVRATDQKEADCLKHVPQTVRDYVQSRRGKFVPIRGFDELMAKLLTKLREKGSVPDLYRRLQDRHRQRERNYDEQQRGLFEAAVSPERLTVDNKPEQRGSSKTDQALAVAVNEIAESRKDKPWWMWLQEARRAKDPDTKERIFTAAIEALPDTPELHRDYACFLSRERSDFAAAEAHFERALQRKPEEPYTLATYADFLEARCNDPVKADTYYRVIRARPDGNFFLTKYASFLSEQGEPDRAERLFERLLVWYPNYDPVLDAYAEFLRKVRGNYVKAEEIERKLHNVKKKRE